MCSNYGYGLTDNSPNTPWNDDDYVPESDFEIEATYTITCKRTVYTDKYIPEYDDETGHVYADTSDINWRGEFESQHFTPIELIEELKKYVENDMSLSGGQNHRLKELLNACDGWKISDTEFEEL